MDKARLLDVVEVLKTVPEHQFDLRYWRVTCGTVGCAVGHYCMARPSKDGLGLNEIDVPSFEGLDNWEAVSKFFGLNQDDAEYLFSSDEYDDENVRRQTVMDRITAFVESGGERP